MKKVLQAILCCLVVSNIQAQDLNFTQFHEQPLLRNPALCGLFSGNFRAQSIYRNQWAQVTVPYRTTGLSLETRAPFCSGGDCENYWTIGAQVTNDVAGDSRLTRWQGMAAIGRHQTLSCDRGDAIIISLMPGFVNSHFDPTRLKWDDEYVAGTYTQGSTNQVLKNSSNTYGELNAGIVYTGAFSEDVSFYSGFSIYHLMLFAKSSSFNINNNITTKPNAKMVMNGGLAMRLNQQQLSLFGDYILQNAYQPSGNNSTSAYKLGRYSTVMAGALITFNPKDGSTQDEDKTSFTAGAVYRWADAIAPVVRLEHRQWNAGFSYDINISKLATASKTYGGFEFTLGYRLNNCAPSGSRCPVRF